jgi:hypothetical protein
MQAAGAAVGDQTPNVYVAEIRRTSAVVDIITPLQAQTVSQSQQLMTTH